MTWFADLSHALADLAEAQAPSLVSVHGHRSRASGFFWRENLIVTADEALPDEGEIFVTLPGGNTNAPAMLIGWKAGGFLQAGE